MEEATTKDVVFHKPHSIKPFLVCEVCKDPDVEPVPLPFHPLKWLATDPPILQKRTYQTMRSLIVKSHNAFYNNTNDHNANIHTN